LTFGPRCASISTYLARRGVTVKGACNKAFLITIMNKKFKQFIALRLVTAIILASTIGTAQAAISDFTWGNQTITRLAYISSGNWSDSVEKVEATPTPTPIKEAQLLSGNTLIASQSPANTKAVKATKPITYVVPATAYSSTPDQTDSTPFITASGTHVRDGVAAANFLPIGTVFRIPDLYGDKIFIVEDRMNKRYTYRVDIWFPTRQAAKNFGLKTIKIEIVS